MSYQDNNFAISHGLSPPTLGEPFYLEMKWLEDKGGLQVTVWQCSQLATAW